MIRSAICSGLSILGSGKSASEDRTMQNSCVGVSGSRAAF